MERIFLKFGELADKVSSNPLFLIAFNAILILLWLTFGTDNANIFISIVTAEIVLVSASAARRGQLALHAKLDELIHNTDARDDLIHLEERGEREIQEIKI